MVKPKLRPFRLQPKTRRIIFKLLVAIFSVSFAFIILARLGKAVKNLDYFRIKDIFIRGEVQADLSYLKGENIFALDIKKEAQYLSGVYPGFKFIRLVKILPNRLFVDFVKRRPLAYVKLYRYFYVDEEAVLFEVPSFQEALELPVIAGLETKIFGPKPGRKYNLRELYLALKVIQEVKRNKALRDYRIIKIEAANPANLSFFLVMPVEVVDYSSLADARFASFEVKIGEENIKDRVMILASLLNEERDGGRKINYVDLRFKEPVIKLKSAK